MTEPTRPDIRPTGRTDGAAGQDALVDEATLHRIVARGPIGTFAVAGVATAIVVAIYFLFYLFAWLPRGKIL